MQVINLTASHPISVCPLKSIDCMSTFEKECLEAHNAYRAQHGCSPLTLDRNLCNFANEWAQYLLRYNIMQHRSNNRYGENIFMASGQKVDGYKPVKSWYDEIKYFNFNGGGFSMNTGHFTQVIWKSSQRLGVGYATNGHTTFVVANYDPPGNFQGRYRENVPGKCC